MPPPEPGVRATRAGSVEGTWPPGPGQEVLLWWGLVSPARSPAGGLQGQLFHLHMGPDKPQKEPASAFPGGSAGPSAGPAQTLLKGSLFRGLPVASCSQPRAHGEGLGLPGDMCWAQLPPLRNTSTPPFPRPPPASTALPWGQAHMLALPRGRGRRGPRGIGM